MLTKGNVMSEHIVQASNKDFDEVVLKSTKPVLVDFWAEWCGPCRMIAPMLDRLAGKYTETLAFVKVNVDENQEIAQKYNVRGIPTLVLFKDGHIVATHVGVATESKLTTFIDEHL
jgi:thioredoxin 1